MGEEIKKALSLKFERKFSEDKCFMEIKEEKIWLYIGFKETLQFNNFMEMYEELARRHKRFHVYTNELNLLLKLYYKRKNLKVKALMVGRLIYGLNVANVVSFKDMKYKFGSDKFSKDVALNLIQKDTGDVRSSFTSNLGKRIGIEYIKEKFPPISRSLRKEMILHSPKGPIIFSSPDQEFENVHCYDGDSAYPAILLEGMLPSKFIKINKIIKGKKYFGRVIIKDLRANDPRYLPLYSTEDLIGEDIAVIGSRVIAAKTYEFYCFLDEKWIIDRYYKYKSFQIDFNNLYMVEFSRLPEKSRSAIKKLYNDKLKAKGTKDYEGIKQIINRVYGFFLTKNGDGNDVRDPEIPYQIGLWIIHKQRMMMVGLIEKVGIQYLVQAHTDGVKFCCDADDIVAAANEKRGIIYKNIGQWKIEETLDRCYYYGHTLGKYQIGDQVGMKHGGISNSDIKEFLEEKTYDDITEKSIINRTVSQDIVVEENRTFIFKKKEPISLNAYCN